MFANIKEFLRKIKDQMVIMFNHLVAFVEGSKRELSNLYQTNYDTGMYHLEHGHLWDATLRFKIIKRFWPNRLEAQYEYAYCLVLQEMNGDAETLLKEILDKDPNYGDARKLLEQIEHGDTKKMVADFKAKFNQEDSEEEKEKNEA